MAALIEEGREGRRFGEGGGLTAQDGLERVTIIIYESKETKSLVR